MRIIGVAAFLFLAISNWASATDVAFPTLKFSEQEPGALFRPTMLRSQGQNDAWFSDQQNGHSQQTSRFDQKTGIIAPPTGIDFKLLVMQADAKADSAMVLNPDDQGKGLTKR